MRLCKSVANSKNIFTLKFSITTGCRQKHLKRPSWTLCEIDDFYIRMINKTNRNYQHKTAGLLDLSMTRINRVFVPDYVIVEFAEEAMRKAHRICQEWTRKISESEPGI